MVDISAFQRNAAAMRDGEWLSPGVQYPGIEFKCRALGHEYLDAFARNTKIQARLVGGEEYLSAEQKARINIDALIETALLDVKGIEERGVPVTLARIAEMMRDPAYAELTGMVFNCASRVGRLLAADFEDAAKNSEPVSTRT